MKKRPTEQQLQAQVDAWNAKYKIGTEVDYCEILGGPPTLRSKTRSEAQVLSGHSAVVWLEAKSGCVCIEHCREVLPGGQYYAQDGTLMNADGTRSIFCDVDQ